MKNYALIIYGPPGSGKGTQAELLARKFNVIHFDTGRYIEGLVHAPGAKKDPILRREGKLFDTGILCTPSWVLKMVREAIKRTAGAGYGMVFSGSPRTEYEAFGDKKNMGIVATLEKAFGKKNVFVIQLDVHSEESLRRNSARLVCSICGLPILATAKNLHCSLCGGNFRKRTLDKPEVIHVRLKEYADRTFPIIAKMKKDGFKIHTVDGMKVPYAVHAEIIKQLKLS